MDNSFIEIIQNQLVSLLQKKQQKFQWNQLRQDVPSHIKMSVNEEGKMFVREDKEDKGLLWYKNLNFPSISIRLRSNKQTEFPETLKCQITVVKLKSNEKPEQSPLLGELEQPFINGSACFPKLKFTQTSHKCGMCLYSLVIIIFNDSESVSQGESGLWSIFYSSSFEIEARQRTLPERVAVQKTTNWSLFNPFLPIFLDKQYETKNKEGDNQIIGSNMDGMFMYLRSPIIRHKVFHPIFLLLKFRDSVRLYYNRNLIQIQEGENLFSKLQRQIFEMLWQQDRPVFLDENKLFILTLKRKEGDNPLTQNEKQIIKYLKSLNGPVATFMTPSFESLPKNFTELKYTDNFIEQYREGFLSMALIDFKRTKMNDSERNLLLEFEGVTQQISDNNPDNNNNNSRNNKQLFAQTIITVNNNYCLDRQDRLKYQCFSHKQCMDKSSPQQYQDSSHDKDVGLKRRYSKVQQTFQRDDLDISEVREKLKKMTKKNNQQKNYSSSNSSSNHKKIQCHDKIANNSPQGNLEANYLDQGINSNKVNKIEHTYQENEQISDHVQTFTQQKIIVEKERCTIGGAPQEDLNKSFSLNFQQNKQDSKTCQTQSTIPQCNTSQNSSSKAMNQENYHQIHDLGGVPMNITPEILNKQMGVPMQQPFMMQMNIPNPAMMNQNQINPAMMSQTQMNPAMMNQNQMNPTMMGQTQMNHATMSQNQMNPYYQTPYIMYPHQNQMSNYYYVQNQQQIHQGQPPNYYQNLIQKQQQIIIEYQKKLEEIDKQSK